MVCQRLEYPALTPVLRSLYGSHAAEYAPGLRLRFDMTAVLYLEHVFGSFTRACRVIAACPAARDCYHFLRAGLSFEFDNRTRIRRRGLGCILPGAAELRERFEPGGIRELRGLILRALADSLPAAAGSDAPGDDPDVDFIGLYLMWASVIGLSDDMFWRATPGEVSEVITAHRALSGEGGGAVNISGYDDDIWA